MTQERARQRELKTDTTVFYNLIPKVTNYHFRCVLFVIHSKPGIMYKGTTQGNEFQKAKVTRGHPGGNQTSNGRSIPSLSLRGGKCPAVEGELVFLEPRESWTYGKRA